MNFTRIIAEVEMSIGFVPNANHIKIVAIHASFFT
jgi:hypothetical protein